MIELKNNVDCCGCNACGDVCAHHAITFKTDYEGFLYPRVDEEKCVDCHLCEKVCPIINSRSLRNNEFELPKCYVANHKNIEVRFDSTSGGMFTAYADWAFNNSFYVGWVVWTENFGAQNYITNDKNDLLKLRNTKYIQSDAQGFYSQVKGLLKAGEKVLICNLPCQIAALKAFLGQEYEDLITIDLFCRGINSPLVFRKFLDSLEKQFGSKVVYVKPKSKDLGWHNLTLKIVFENGKTYYGTKDVDFFTNAFLNSNCISRPSCYDCKFKGFPRVADISIGDFWRAGKVESKAIQLDDNLGTSAILVNSSKGERLMQEVAKKIVIEEEALDIIVDGNRALIESLGAEKTDRSLFYNKINNGDFIDVVSYLFPKKYSFKRKLKNILKAWYLQVVTYGHFHPRPIWQFVKYNFLTKEIKNISLSKGRVIILTRYCDIEIHRKALVEINGTVIIGASVFRNTRKESRIRVMPGGRFVIDGDWSCGDGANIEVFSTGELTRKHGPWANVNLCIICMDKILLDEWAMIGRDVTIRDNNGGHPIGIYGSKTHMPIIIGKHVWLTSNCTVMMGVKIGDGSIVGSNSLVTSSQPANCIINGSPAKVTQKNILWRF